MDILHHVRDKTQKKAVTNISKFAVAKSLLGTVVVCFPSPYRVATDSVVVAIRAKSY